MPTKNKKKTKKRSAAAAKPSSANNAQKRSQPKQAEKKPVSKSEQPARKKNNVFMTILPYVLAVFAVFFAACLLTGQGSVGGAIKFVLTGLFAGAAYVFPVFIILRAILARKDNDEGMLTSRSICLFVSFILLTVFLHIVGGGSQELDVARHFSDGTKLIGGGATGGLIGSLMLKGFGSVCSLIILIFAFIVLMLYFFGLSPKRIYIYIAYKIKFAGERREEKKQEKEEKLKNKQPTRAEIREEEYLTYLRRKKEEKKSGKHGRDKTEPALPSSQPDVPMITGKKYRLRKARLSETIEAAPGSDDVSNVVNPSIQGIIDGEYDADIDSAVDAQTEKNDTTDMPEGYDADTYIAAPDQETLDEIKFEEVMRRTTERMENSKFVVEASEHPDVPYAPEVENIVPAGDSKKVIEQVTIPLDGQEESDSSGIFANSDVRKKMEELAQKVSKDPSLSGGSMKQARQSRGPYKFPPIALLNKGRNIEDKNVRKELEENGKKLVKTLESFKVNTKIENISRGPTVTRYELIPQTGIKVKSIMNLRDDIALNLAAQGVRIEAPIPGKAAVGVEVSNKVRQTVYLRSLIANEKFTKSEDKLLVAIGQDVAGDPVYFNMSSAPHLLIAGATGAGKSVCLNSIIISILYRNTPDEVKLLLIDPKQVEFVPFTGIPHLLVPPVNDPKKAAGSLSWAVGEMERRYNLISETGFRNVEQYNKKAYENGWEYLPYIVIIIDELADLMFTAPQDVETSINRIAAKARAAGMHLIIGTQRPSTDVITGTIKANIPSRIAFRTASQVDSKTILDLGSAANLVGKGDMLFKPVGELNLKRIQGAFVSDEEIENIVSYIKEANGGEDYSEAIQEQIEKEALKCGKKTSDDLSDVSDEPDDSEDPMLRKAVELAINEGKISTSLIQRRLSLGYGRAAKLIDKMESLGYVSAPDGQKPREVLITKERFMEMRLKNETPFDN